jgi:membrane protein implicated in regulation of membrane protease activity
MSIERLAFWFGFLELGFVLLVAGFFPTGVFVVWSGGACICLMAPYVRAKVSEWASRRPKTVGVKGSS